MWPFLLTTLLSPLYMILTIQHRFNKHRNDNLCADCMRKKLIKLLLTTYMNGRCARIQFHQRVSIALLVDMVAAAVALWDDHPKFLTMSEFSCGQSLVTRLWQHPFLNMSYSVMYDCHVIPKTKDSATFLRQWLYFSLKITRHSQPYSCLICYSSSTRVWDLHCHIFILRHTWSIEDTAGLQAGNLKLIKNGNGLLVTTWKVFFL